MHIMLASSDLTVFNDVFQVLKSKDNMKLSYVGSAAEGMELINEGDVDVVAASEQLSDSSGLAFIRKVVTEYPLLNCALVSSLSAEDFHEATEGLGLFFQFPQRPDAASAEKMIELLDKIYMLNSRVGGGTQS